MHIISIRRLREFWQIHPAAQRPLQAWYTQCGKGRWHNLAELRQIFPTADQVRRLTVFNIAGNKYRLIARVEYEQQKIYIRAILTHAEYDKEGWKNDSWFL
ncbi:MAG: type II toxin-antitoxin system HigB family toxin [Caldilineaceae bacterium]|nr:type II toxin-antitoxin system HigB family toxin [Caldilineaceae bacterium]